MVRVKYFYPWGAFHPVGCGADLVARNHLSYFRARGWSVECLVARDHRPGAEAAFRTHYDWLEHVAVTDVPSYRWAFRDVMAAMTTVAGSEPGRTFLGRPADVFVTNYVFTAPLIEHLPRGCKRVLETVDLMAEQFAMADTPSAKPDPLRQASREYLLRVELEQYRLFDACAMINPDEESRVRARGLNHAFYVPQVCDRPPASSGPAPAPAYDLLFVGSANPINSAGLRSFYDHVFVPYLRRHGVTLAVVGGVAASAPDDAQVHRLGRVDGPLSDVYARTRVVVVPVLQGTGLSVKTLEALSHGKAIVSTPAGVRGLDDTSRAYRTVDMQGDPATAAATVLALLESPGERRALEARALAYVQRAFSREAHSAAMDRVMAAAGIPVTPLVSASAA
jgi:glycosyltransferase involved in cell wall biosynthesis